MKIINLLSVIEQRSLKNPNLTAIIDFKKKISYSQLYRMIFTRARSLYSHVSKVDNVIISLHDTALFIEVYSAVILLRKTPIVVDSIVSLNESNYFLNKNYFILNDAALKNISTKTKLTNHFKNLPNCLKSPGIALQTSGSTGEKKIAVLSQNSLIYSVKNSPIFMSKRKFNKRVLTCLPHSHLAGFYSGFLMPFISGGTVIINNEFFNPQKIMKMIHRHKITDMLVVPAILKAIGLIHNVKPYSGSIVIWIGGDKLSEEDFAIARNIFPNARFFNCYAMTEVPRISCLNINKYPDKINSVGQIPKGVEIKINKPNNAGIGEIFVRGPSRMISYLNSKPLLKNSWFMTGDFGFIDKNKFLYLVGRKKNIIKFNSYTLFPEQIEKIILQMPSVLNCVVVGIPHAVLGHYPAAAIVTEKCGVTEKILKDFCYKNLKVYEIPKKFIFLKQLPTTSIGKISRPLVLDIINKNIAKDLNEKI